MVGHPCLEGQTVFCSFPLKIHIPAFVGIVFIPGTTQLTANDIQYRLHASKAKCIITTDVLAPAVDSVAAGCGHLQSKLMVAEGRRDGWLDFNELLK